MTVVEDWLAGGGEMATLIQIRGSASLGSVETWSWSLKTSLSILLNACSPMFLIWGRDRIFFCNDAYAALLKANNYPVLVGQSINDTWVKNWNSVRSDIEQVFATQKPLQRQHQPFPPDPNNHTKAQFYTWSYSPIRDETAPVSGVFASGCQVFCPETLSKSEERDQAFIEQSSEAIWRFEIERPLPIDLAEDEQIQHIYQYSYLAECNQVTAQMYGFTSPEDLIGLRLDAFLVRSDPRNTDYLRAFIRSGYRLIDAESYEVDGQGNPKIFSNNLVGAIANGMLLRAWGTQRDITERKQAEIALYQSQQRAQLAIKVAQLGTWQYNPDTNFVELDERMCQIWGEPSDNRIMPLSAAMERIHPNDRSRVAQTISTALDPQSSGNYEIDYRIVWPDGTERWILATGQAQFEGEGQTRRPSNFFGTALDITDRKQAEVALRNSAEQLNLALAAAKLGDWSWEAATDRVIFSERATEIFELLPGSELTWAQIRGLLHPDDREWARLQVEQAIAQHSDYDIEYRIIRADGSAKWIAAKGRGQYDASGQALGMLGVVQDITDRKQAEAALAAQEQRYRYIFEAVSVSIWEEDFSEVKAAIAQLKAAGVRDFHQYFAEHPEFVQQALAWVKLRDVNQASLRMFGAENKAQLLASLGQIFVAETQDAFIKELLAIADEKTFFAAETVLQTLQGDRIDVWFTIAFPSALASYDRVLVSLLDISDRKQVEAALRQSEERYRCLAESIPQLVWTADAEGVLLDVNQRWLDFTGLTLTQAQTQGWEAVVHPDDLSNLSQQWVAAQHNGTYYQAAGRMRRKDGGYRWHLHQAVPLKNEQNQVVKWFGTATDIEDQKQLEQQRFLLLQQEQAAREESERANRIKDEFLAVLSHELRSPLNPILGWAKLLKERKLNEQTTQRALETIERNAKLQTQLIEDLLDVSRILRGKMVLNVTPVHLVSIAQAAIETVQLAAEAKQIEIQTTFAAEVEQVFGDAARLQQIVWNLLSNAVKFTPKGGQVQVRVESVGSQAQIQVIDTGKGINPEFLPYVFEYFYQEDSTTTRKFGGLGLGLAIVRHLVELHGGTVQVESAGEGLGAIFTVQIPLKAIPVESVRAEHLTAHSMDLSGLRILVVDDEADMRDLVEFILEQHGAQVSAVASAQAAIAALDAFQPDILISDIGMPRVDGYALMRQIKAQAREIPAIALTAYAGEYDRQQALAVGFQQHIAKPVEPEQLVSAIANLTR